MIMIMIIARVHPVHLMNIEWRQSLHPPSPFIITQRESCYSFYRPTEGRRLSRPSWLVIHRDGLPAHRRSPILVLTGSYVAQLC